MALKSCNSEIGGGVELERGFVVRAFYGGRAKWREKDPLNLCPTRVIIGHILGGARTGLPGL